MAVQEKITEIIVEQLGVKPEEVTPEATADNIVSHVTSLFSIFQKQNPNLSDEDVLNKFLDEVKRGVKEGYDDAYSTLDSLGAFQFDGVKDGVEQTKKLIEEKLKKFEAQKREELGLPPLEDTVKSQVQTKTSNSLLAQGGVNVIA